MGSGLGFLAGLTQVYTKHNTTIGIYRIRYSFFSVYPMAAAITRQVSDLRQSVLGALLH